ncbi:MAG: ABC transporter permease [Lachnospiraceae bacterium]|nr:ABC transporter permease [Lachnospiraceae bacterium]
MLKTIKYEFRRSIGAFIILAVIFGLLELYYFYGILADKTKHMGIAIVLLMIASMAMFFFVLIFSITSYKHDIEQKQGYLVFMTPTSTYSVIGAKLITTLITGIVIVAVIFGLFALDWKILMNKDKNLKNTIDVLHDVFETMGFKTDKIILGLLATVFVFLISFYLLVAIAYLAISLSNTLLSNKRGKGFISFVFFIILYIVITIISNKLPHIGSDSFDNLTEAMRYNIPQYLFNLVMMIACFYSSAWLLNNKINL